MKRDHWIYIIGAIAILYFAWPHVRGGYARAKALLMPNSASPVVDGTAHSGADATVLTASCN